MPATIRFIGADSNRKCSNGCLIRSFYGEKFWQVFNANGKPRSGERYCTHCKEYAVMNNTDAVLLQPGEEPPEAEEPPRPGLVKVAGDNRWFARTRRGLRAGYEHTGQRCEDAPCCGCCD